MGAIFSAQYMLGLSIGFGLWLLTYCLNRAWLGFWSFLR